MATRHNTCVNPACKVDVSGWAGASTPTRVTGLAGMNRTTGARYTAGGFIQTPAGAAAPGDVVTMSLDVLTEVFDDPSVDVYFFVTRSSGGDAQVGALESTTLNFGVVKRFAITRTCPANTTGAYMIVDGVNMVISPTNYTALLTEVAPAADTYFDGDSPGASWDGTPGLSASTFQDVVDLTFTGTLPELTGAFAVDALDDVQLAGTLPALTAAFTVDATSDLVLTAQLPAMAAAFTIGALSDITLAGLLPALVGHLTDGSDVSKGVGSRDTARTPGGRHVHTTPAGRSVP
jgi:hypothetical protein